MACPIYASRVPLLVLLVVVLAIPLVMVVLTPLMLIQRYRVGTARRQARGWLATINIVAFTLSIAIFLFAAAVTSVWVPRAFTYSLAGLACGALLGLAGLAVSRWEISSGVVHYTPNRWLVLLLTVAVSARLLYGIWRSWETWSAGLDPASWLAASGAAGSLGVGALVLGYYLAYWLGVRRRMAQYQRRRQRAATP